MSCVAEQIHVCSVLKGLLAAVKSTVWCQEIPWHCGRLCYDSLCARLVVYQRRLLTVIWMQPGAT